MNEAELWELAERVMTKNQHLAFWLHFNADFSYVEISRMLGISRQAVQDRVEGGRRRLEQACQEQEAA